METGLTHPILWMSGKSKNVEAASRVYFPLPDLSRKIERDSARRVSLTRPVRGLQCFKIGNIQDCDNEKCSRSWRMGIVSFSTA